MAAYILQRLIQSAIVLLAVAMLAFVLFRFVGDPVDQMVSMDTPMDVRDRIRADLGLDQPLPVQFLTYLGRSVSLDFGVSYQSRQPVAQIIAARMPATLELAVVASILTMLIGVPLGILTAIYRQRWWARGVQILSVVGMSLPTFFIGVLMIFVFAVQLRWLPSFGRGDTVDIGGWSTGLLTSSGWRSMILPAATLALFQMALILRLVRAEMLEILRSDFIRFARARGLKNRAIYLSHALRNTLIPVVTIGGLQLGSIIAFGIVTETVFQWPGMGLVFLQAVQSADVPIMNAYLLMTAVIFVFINFVVDVSYLFIDPRIRLTGATQ